MTNFIDITEYFDHNYRVARDAFIPQAVTKANRAFGAKPKSNNEKTRAVYAANWTGCYITEMNRLVTEARLRSK
jgi:hypothetical protein